MRVDFYFSVKIMDPLPHAHESERGLLCELVFHDAYGRRQPRSV